MIYLNLILIIINKILDNFIFKIYKKNENNRREIMENSTNNNQLIHKITASKNTKNTNQCCHFLTILNLLSDNLFY